MSKLQSLHQWVRNPLFFATSSSSGKFQKWLLCPPLALHSPPPRSSDKELMLPDPDSSSASPRRGFTYPDKVCYTPADSFTSFIALRRPKALHNCRITHIVSVLEWQFEQDNPLTRGFQHLHVPVDDVEDENLLAWFPRTNSFIHAGLNYWRTSKDAKSRPDLESGDEDRGSGVLIHW